VKPQRPQRKTLCPQKDPPPKEISERQGACEKSVRDEVNFDGRRQGKAQDEVQVGIYLSGFGKRMEFLIFLGDPLKEEGKRLKIRGHRGEGNKDSFSSLKINLFSVSSVAGF